MKKAIIISIVTLLSFTSCNVSLAQANEQTNEVSLEQSDGFKTAGFLSVEEFQEQIDTQLKEAEAQRKYVKALRNSLDMAGVLSDLKKHVGKTGYSFAGSTPNGWDCSGLVKWTYAQMGVELYHGANSQLESGTIVENPVPGDLVGYYYEGSSRAFHVGIYVGDGQVIHALNPRVDTRMESATDGIANYGNIYVQYVRVIPLIELPSGTAQELPETAK